jgi:hypothetical protein
LKLRLDYFDVCNSRTFLLWSSFSLSLSIQCCNHCFKHKGERNGICEVIDAFVLRPPSERIFDCFGQVRRRFERRWPMKKGSYQLSLVRLRQSIPEPLVYPVSISPRHDSVTVDTQRMLYFHFHWDIILIKREIFRGKNVPDSLSKNEKWGLLPLKNWKLSISGSQKLKDEYFWLSKIEKWGFRALNPWKLFSPTAFSQFREERILPCPNIIYPDWWPANDFSKCVNT